jgi:activator of HSP90 ATPase
MDPVTALMLFQAGMKLFQGLQESDAIKQKSQANADYYNDLAKQQEQEIYYSGKQAGKTQSELRQQSSSLAETQKAAIAGSGSTLSSVTAEDIAYDTLSKQLKDEMAIKYNADLLRQQQLKKSDQFREAGRGEIEAGNIQSFNTLLSTASNVASSFIPRG